MTEFSIFTFAFNKQAIFDLFHHFTKIIFDLFSLILFNRESKCQPIGRSLRPFMFLIESNRIESSFFLFSHFFFMQNPLFFTKYYLKYKVSADSPLSPEMALARHFPE
jgi:hypothetical protein